MPKDPNPDDDDDEESPDDDAPRPSGSKRKRKGKTNSGGKRYRGKPIVPDSDRKPSTDKLSNDELIAAIQLKPQKKINVTSKVWDRSQDMRDLIKRRLDADDLVFFFCF